MTENTEKHVHLEIYFQYFDGNGDENWSLRTYVNPAFYFSESDRATIEAVGESQNAQQSSNFIYQNFNSGTSTSIQRGVGTIPSYPLTIP